MKRSKKVIFQIVRTIFLFLFIIIFQPRIVGRENIPKKGGAVLASNHRHAIDPCLTCLSTNRPVTYLAKRELFDGLFGWFFVMMSCLPVDRNSSSHQTTVKAIEIASKGNLIGIFPEGSRNKFNDELQPLKMGTVRIAKEANVPIIPFAITGKCRPFGGYKATFGKPIDVSDLEYEEANQLLYNTLKELIAETR